MINEIMSKFPEMVKALLEKAQQSDVQESPKRKMAREKLMSQLKSATEELSKLSDVQGEKLSEEQVKEILSIPRPLPQNIPWAFLKGGK